MQLEAAAAIQATAMTRIQRAQQLMAETGIDLLLIGPSADFRYLTGRRANLTERLTALLLPLDRKPLVLLPRLSAPVMQGLEDSYEVVLWRDGQDPLQIASKLIEDLGSKTIAPNDELWSVFVLPLQQRISGVRWASSGPVLSTMRQRKDADELATMKEASRRHDLVWEEFCTTSKLTGRTESDVRTQMQQLMLAHGLTDIVWCDVGSGPNSASPLHVGDKRVIERGDPVVIDFAAAYEGYFGDACRMVVASEPSRDLSRAYNAVLQAQQAAFKSIRAGMTCEAIDRVARDSIEAAGYGEYFTHRVGHGIGLAPHEHPYLVSGNNAPLEAGNTVSDEPGVYIQGRWGIRIEDIVAVRTDGAESFNQASRELVVLG